MEFVELLEHVSPLLDACVCDEVSAIRALRLVSKAASRVALLGLRSYTLALEGFAEYRKVSEASLLQHAHLQDLSIHLLLSGTFSPAIMLEAFVRAAGPSLSTVTSLALRLENTSRSACTAEVLDKVMMALVSACPTLKSFTFRGHLSSMFLQALGEKCTLLNDLTYVGPSTADHAYLQQMLLQQPSQLPHINSLTFQDCDEDYDSLPNMAGNTSITRLQLHMLKFCDEAEWLLLPPNLQHLKCDCITKGPPATTRGSSLLGHLLTLELCKQPPRLPLDVYSRLLHAAPAFEGFHPAPVSGQASCIIKCHASGEETSPELAFLLTKAELLAVRNAKYSMFMSPKKSWLPVITVLPVMTGVTRLKVVFPNSEDLSALLRNFRMRRSLS